MLRKMYFPFCIILIIVLFSNQIHQSFALTTTLDHMPPFITTSPILLPLLFSIPGAILDVATSLSSIPFGTIPTNRAPPPSLLREPHVKDTPEAATTRLVEATNSPGLSLGLTVPPRIGILRNLVILWILQHPNQSVELCDNVNITMSPEGHIQFDVLLQPFGLICVIADTVTNNRVNPALFDGFLIEPIRNIPRAFLSRSILLSKPRENYEEEQEAISDLLLQQYYEWENKNTNESLYPDNHDINQGSTSNLRGETPQTMLHKKNENHKASSINTRLHELQRNSENNSQKSRNLDQLNMHGFDEAFKVNEQRQQQQTFSKQLEQFQSSPEEFIMSILYNAPQESVSSAFTVAKRLESAMSDENKTTQSFYTTDLAAQVPTMFLENIYFPEESTTTKTSDVLPLWLKNPATLLDFESKMPEDYPILLDRLIRLATLNEHLETFTERRPVHFLPQEESSFHELVKTFDQPFTHLKDPFFVEVTANDF